MNSILKLLKEEKSKQVPNIIGVIDINVENFWAILAKIQNIIFILEK